MSYNLYLDRLATQTVRAIIEASREVYDELSSGEEVSDEDRELLGVYFTETQTSSLLQKIRTGDNFFNEDELNLLTSAFAVFALVLTDDVTSPTGDHRAVSAFVNAIDDIFVKQCKRADLAVHIVQPLVKAKLLQISAN